MCDITMLLIAGAVVQGVGAVMQLSAQKKNSEMQAELAEKQAGQVYEAGAFASKQVARDVDRISGQQIAAFAEGGLEFSGSNRDVHIDTLSEGDLDVATIMHNAGSQSENLKFEAGINRQNARSAGAAMPFAFLTPLFNTAARFPGVVGL